MLSDCLSIEDGLVFGNHVWVTTNESFGLFVRAQLNVDLCANDIGHSLDHQTHLIRCLIEIKIELLRIHKIPFFVVCMSVSIMFNIVVIAWIPLILVELLVCL